MNECQAVRDLVALRSSDWSADERRRVETHLKGCPDCAALARAYAGQDRLIQAAPRLRLTRLQRAQVLSRIQRERRRHQMRTRIVTAFGTATAAMALVALALGLYALFQGSDQLTIDLPSPTDEAVLVPQPPVFADQVRVGELLVEAIGREPISLTAGALVTPGLHVLGGISVPGAAELSVTWQVVAPPSANWQVFVHLMNEEGELALQSDVDVDWPVRPCPGGGYGPECTATSAHQWVFPADFPPGQYTVTVGLYDPETGVRAPTNPASETSSLALGQVRVTSGESESERVQVTLMVFSGRSNPSWSLTPAQDAELRQRLAALAPTDQVFDEAGRLGYAGFRLLVSAVEDGPTGQVNVWNGVVHKEMDDRVTLLADENRALERWLLETAAGQVEEKIIREVRGELELSSLAAELGIYLVNQDVSTLEMSGSDCTELDAPIVALDDILSYHWDTHEIELTDSAYERIAQLEIPMAPGLPFALCVGREAIYRGAFWTMASSASFDGIVILLSPRSDKPSIRIQLGYPSPDFFTGEDLRADPRVFQSLEKAGKIQLPTDVPHGSEDNAYPIQYVEKVYSTPDLTQTDSALDLLEGGSMSCGSVSVTNSFAYPQLPIEAAGYYKLGGELEYNPEADVAILDGVIILQMNE